MKHLILLFIIISQQGFAQISGNHKLIISGKYGYYCNNKKDNTVLLTKIDLASNNIDSMYIHSKSTGLFSEHPIIWELKDSLIFQLRLINAGDGMPNPELHVYNGNQIKKYTGQGAGHDYLFSNETLKDKEVGPLSLYIRRIYYREDTLKGPIFFDLIQKKDSMFLYIYIQDKKMFEVWNFNRFPLIIKNMNSSDANKILKKNTWGFQKTIMAEINRPFQLVDIHDKVYAFDDLGNIWDLSGVQAQRKHSIPAANKRGAMIINKDNQTVKYFRTSEIDKSNKGLVKKIKKSSVDIKIK